MNPPTIGHAKLVKKVQDVAKSEKADARVYLSHTQNNKKDPLDYNQKIRFAKKAFGNIVTQSNSKTVFQIMSELQKDGYTDVIMVVGSDRVPEFKQLLNKYNGKDYNFDSISVVSAGERDPDATGVEGMSASKLRAVAKSGDFDTFKQGLPKGLSDSDAKSIFNIINKVIKEELEEQRKPLTLMQRQKRARMMRRLAPKLARFRKMKAKRMADREKLLYRAQKAARNIIRKKVAGDRGAEYSSLGAAEKITIDKLVAKKSAVIQKLAKRLLPKVRKAEIERLKQARSGPKNEEFDFDREFEILFEAEERKKEVAQDPDVKDMPGTQPKKYYKGLSDKEKEARAKQFARQAKKDDDDPSAYKAPASNKDAETKPSKHTKKYRAMFGEQDAVSRAKEAIKREKEADKAKHDRALDRARTQDTQAKNRQTEEYELSEDASNALQKKADKSGIPVGILRQVYNRGMAAWKTGHRPGATQQQWAFARVNSFITGGKTRTTADADLWAKAKGKKEEVELGEAKYGFFGSNNPKIGERVKHKSGASGTIKKISTQGDDTQVYFKLDKDVKISGFPHRKGQIVSFDAKYLSPMKEEVELDEKCWDGYRQAGMKKKGDKMVPDCVPESAPKKKKLNAMLGVPTARPVVPMGEETIEEMPRWLLEPLSKVTRKKGYDSAKKVLQDVLTRKKKEAGKKGLPHTVEYYAQQIAKQFQGVDARVLADMVTEQPEKMDAPEIGTDKIKKRYSEMTPGQINESYVFAKDEIKIQGAFEHHPTTDFQEDYLGWTLEEDTLEEAEYQGRKVKLRDPFRTPKGPKKFSVYVKNPKTDNVIKVNFGDPDMEIKRDDPESRKNFRARHNCDDKTDETTAGYWSCRFWSKNQTVSDLD